MPFQDPPRKRKRPLDGTEELRARLQRYEMQLLQSGATLNENGDVITPPVPTSLPTGLPTGLARNLKTLVPAPSPTSTIAVNRPANPPPPPPSYGGTLADALRDASRQSAPRVHKASDGRLITDRGKSRYLEKYVHLLFY